jgi:AraC-like DNA-binding protein
MHSKNLATHSLPRSRQFEMWRNWYGSVYETTPLMQSAREGFLAANSIWTLDGLTVSCVSSPALSIARTNAAIRRDPVDHWVIMFGKRTETEIRSGGAPVRVPPRVPVIVSLGEELDIKCGGADRIRFYLSRDRFSGIAPILDAARAERLNSQGVSLLSDYLLLMERHLPQLGPDEAAHLPNAIEAMLAACLAPTVDRVAGAKCQIDSALMERVRRVVGKNLRCWTLGVGMVCREAGMSRSQLYRILEIEGGVANYIRRRRLKASFVLLSDISTNETIGRIAELLCFSDVSSFSRAFRREFGVSPREVRAAARAGLYPPTPPRGPSGSDINCFADCLRA